MRRDPMRVEIPEKLYSLLKHQITRRSDIAVTSLGYIEELLLGCSSQEDPSGGSILRGKFQQIWNHRSVPAKQKL